MVSKPPKIDQVIVVTALPLYHIFALTACLLFSVGNGGMCILIPNPRDIGGLIKELSHYKVNLFPAVNTLYNALLNHPDFGKLDLSMLKSAVAGGMAVQKPVADAWMKATGHPIVEGYGLSETSPVLTVNRGDIAEWTGTIGLPVPSTEITIRDDAGHDVPIGEQGEICARGPQVMPGYWNRPDETAKVMTADGFFRTGDIGVMDADGRVKIIDRKKDMISVSGFKVFPNEVEDVAMMQGGILECAAVGVPDSPFRRGGQTVRGEEIAGIDRASFAQVHAHRACRLQSAQAHRVPHRTAEDQCRQDPAPRAAGRGMSEPAALPSAADVVAFWRASRSGPLVQEGPRLRRRDSPALP